MDRCGSLNLAFAVNCVIVLLVHSIQARIYAQIPTHFEVPGHQEQIDALGKIQTEFGGSFTNCALWDAWIPYSTLWTNKDQAQRYREVYLQRPIDSEGYVSMQQHRGMAHSEGWPFPAWQQSTGSGWHFSTSGEGWAIQNFNLQPLTNAEDWLIEGASIKSIDPERGLILETTVGSPGTELEFAL